MNSVGKVKRSKLCCCASRMWCTNKAAAQQQAMQFNQCWWSGVMEVAVAAERPDDDEADGKQCGVDH